MAYSPFGVYSSTAEMEARLYSRREVLQDKKAKERVLQDKLQAQKSVVKARRAIEAAAWKGEEPPPPKALLQSNERIKWGHLWSEQVAADRAALIGRASATFIYHIQDPVAAKRFSPYLWTAYGCGMAVLGVIYVAVKAREWSEDASRPRLPVDDLMREIQSSSQTQ
ncbi:hypothetical protein HDU96_008834 [Phlyctochytrium bullatum]|nr:hypothetical protein HDU96_008834 [Phlyctochytrium bullatum]